MNLLIIRGIYAFGVVLAFTYNVQKSQDVLDSANFGPGIIVQSKGGFEPRQGNIYSDDEITIDHLDKGDEEIEILNSSISIGSQQGVNLIPQNRYNQDGVLLNPNPEIELGPNSNIVVHGNLSTGCLLGDCGCKSPVCDPPTNGNRNAHINTESTPDVVVTSASEMQMYPNPFNENVVITFPSQEEVEVEYILFDIQGREVERGVLQSKQVNSNEGQVVFRGAHLKAGIYLFQIQAGEKIHRGKLIKSE
ncbi:MAG: T9SS type A sorting domain-containing protein [Bacteroidota bacterium]